MSDKLTTSIEQPIATAETTQDGPSMGFFGVGIVINLLLIAAYFIWAYKQGKKSGKRDHE